MLTNGHQINGESFSKESIRSELLISPGELLKEYPCSPSMQKFILEKRQEISSIVNGIDDRLLVVIGPCSIHNIEEALEYAKKLSVASKEYQSTLLIVMRVYFEKPRTTVGWKGLIYDPYLDGTNNTNKGLVIARQLLISVNELELSCATELLQPMVVPYIADLISWSAIGARTTESQIHREMVSGLNMSVGFKNGTTGCIKCAINACLSSSKGHSYFSINSNGNIINEETNGNADVHVVLRGGSLSGPNYSSEHVISTQELLNENQIKNKIMIDCSHGNSLQDGERQKLVVEDICKQMLNGDCSIMGVMIESNLVGGRQTFVQGKKHSLEYGKSITDSCLGWDQSIEQLKLLSQAVYDRRKRQKQSKY